jgi:hypothetical protein
VRQKPHIATGVRARGLGLRIGIDNESSVRLTARKPSLGQVVSSDGPDDAPERHEVQFALVMERRAKGAFEAELREPPDQGATEPSTPDPNVTLAK